MISDTPKWSDADADHTWWIHRRDDPTSNLVVLEPQACREVLADTVEVLRFSHNMPWECSSWDEMRIALTKDLRCTLTLRVPVSTGNPLEWPFNTGRVLLVACKDEACTFTDPTIADLTEKYRSQREKGAESVRKH